MIGCPCAVCTSADPRNRRTRTSIHVVMDGLHVQVDAAPGVPAPVRAGRASRSSISSSSPTGTPTTSPAWTTCGASATCAEARALPVYSTEEGMGRVPRRSIPTRSWTGRSSAAIRPSTSPRMPAVLELPQGTIQSTLLPHGGDPDARARLHRAEQRQKVRLLHRLQAAAPTRRSTSRGVPTPRSSTGCGPMPHPSHMSIDEAVSAGQALGAKRTWLTHLTHLTDHAAAEAAASGGLWARP